jgi:CSLREA domain-containing protein
MGRSGRWWRVGVALCATGAVMGIGAATASAATLTVNTTGDNGFGGSDGGFCTLRDAIFAVESPGTSTTCGVADSGANTIVLGPHTYLLNDNQIRGMPPPSDASRGVPVPAAAMAGAISLSPEPCRT